jgi:hypothetical protein
MLVTLLAGLSGTTQVGTGPLTKLCKGAPQLPAYGSLFYIDIRDGRKNQIFRTK